MVTILTWVFIILVVIWVGFLLATIYNWIKDDIIGANKTCLIMAIVTFLISIINLIIYYIK